MKRINTKLSLIAIASALFIAGCASKTEMSDSKTEMAGSKAEAAMDATSAPAMAGGSTMEQEAGARSGFESRIQEYLAMPHRSQVNKARDQYRHPAQTLAFFGLTENQTVVEITPGGGWYTEILAPFLRASGRYIAVINDPAKTNSEGAKNYYSKQNAEFDAKLKANPELYDKTQTIMIDGGAPDLGAPGSADMVLTFRNAHNWMSQGSEKAMFKAFFTVLKSGGKLGMTDHRALPGTDWKVSSKTGYVSEESVIKLAEEAGFVLFDRSEINANPKDTRDHPEGVWTLPPTLALGDKDKEKYLAIGESDRMTLVFRKP
jgi:predicted methyltransferase